jgi:hypothetical protein
MTLSSHQPNFLPYMGFFYKMDKADVFVLSSEHQFSTSGMHNYNYAKISGARKKITVPITREEGVRICDTRIYYQSGFVDEILKSMAFSYKKAPHFMEGYEFLKWHLTAEYEYLAELNTALIREIASRFGIRCKILDSRNFGIQTKKQERYYSGTGGKAYTDESLYDAAGLNLIYSDYSPVRYEQVGGGEFIENLSVIDWIMNKGFVKPEGW